MWPEKVLSRIALRLEFRGENLTDIKKSEAWKRDENENGISTEFSRCLATSSSFFFSHVVLFDVYDWKLRNSVVIKRNHPPRWPQNPSRTTLQIEIYLLTISQLSLFIAQPDEMMMTCLACVATSFQVYLLGDSLDIFLRSFSSSYDHP